MYILQRHFWVGLYFTVSIYHMYHIHPGHWLLTLFQIFYYSSE